MKPVLKIDWATHEAAKYACENWHYSKCVPKSKLVKIGAWEDGRFIGVVIFGSGASPQIGNPYKLNQTEACELVRIALTKHITPVSKIAAIAIRFLKANNPGLRLVISYADPLQGHHGGIYQAGNWVYSGKTTPCEWFKLKSTGELIHSHSYRRGRRGRATRDKEKGIIESVKLTKHKYLMPLDNEMRKRILPLSKPYPKRAGSETTDTAGHQPAEGGSIPTPALHSQAA
jgi:hypothetical protein